ncbi:MAG: 3-hydroxyacyl-CoA dehydrogenase/enoyl-CoA hydratase family protein [Alicyclobacillaceae bacterium]|nr:3-hydroxyacyl-CoA dehydrogenase/enoyl-CoA hydratase family protein [Alicyclobacillaceae bacterium]
MARTFQTAAVIGAGVMGAAIAAHLANAGLRVWLLDVVPEELTPEEAAQGLTIRSPQVRNRLAARALERLRTAKPPALFTPDTVRRIQVGNLADDLPRLRECDWVIEAVVEDLDVKRSLWENVEPYLRPDAVASTNTSGLSIRAIAEGRTAGFRQQFFGTHFFNPPRYMKLVEVIPGPDTNPERIDEFCRFAERVLGKGVVVAKDTPNFIANRIGTYGVAVTLAEMERFGFGIDDVDAITGPVMGRPKSATFRTLDMVGLDTFLHVADHMAAAASAAWERQAFSVPAWVRQMAERGWLGEKSGQGFYRRVQEAGSTDIQVIDPATLTYGPRRKFRSPVMQAAAAAPAAAERIRLLVQSPEDAGRFAWAVLKRVLLYTAHRQFEMADDIQAVDRAMRWGFNWDLGPYEVWDAIGLVPSVERMKLEGEDVPEWVLQWIAAGRTSFYVQDTGGIVCCPAVGGGRKVLEARPEHISLDSLKQAGCTVRSNPGASLIDIGDGVACLQFHSPKQAIGTDVLQMLAWAADEAEVHWEGLVIAGDAPHFSVGANLMLMLMEAEDGNWDEIDRTIRLFHQTVMRLKYLAKPVVAAPYGRVLGGGAEICLSSHRMVAAAETYMGLVETGVGLIPAGGGTKEMLIRAVESVPPGTAARLDPFVQRAFETIALAKVSTSAADAKQLGYLRAADTITMNADERVYRAKQMVLGMARAGFRPPEETPVPVIGEDGAAALKVGVYLLRESRRITEHDAKIAHHLIRILTGGSVPRGTLVSERYLLDLEREAFLSLVGEPKTQQRMRHMLATGKPLRN